MGLVVRGAVFFALYLLVCMAPLIAATVGAARPGRDFLVELSVGLGFVGLAMLALQFVLASRVKPLAAPFGMDVLIQFHRQIAWVALAFVLAHPLLLVVDNLHTLRMFNPVEAPWRARVGVAAAVLLVLLVVLSAWRRKLRLSYEAWQLTHEVLAVVIVALALWHVVMVGHYLGDPWTRALWIALTASLACVLGWTRLVKPLGQYRRPWRVESVTPERGDAWTLALTPVGHEGFRFQPGQFGWIVLGRSPFALTQHPFSFSSSAECVGSVAVTIKARGDFTASVAAVRCGTRAYVDGPHGVFTPDRHEGPGFVLVAGGVGITPLMSQLRTMADRADVRPVVVFYGNRDWESVMFREEPVTLAEGVNATVVHVLESPPQGWTGETGFITAQVIERHLPSQYRGFQYFVCGPRPMVDAMESALSAVGVTPERVQTERFDMV